MSWRMPATLKARLTDAAALNDRSLAREIEARLEASLAADQTLGGPWLVATFRHLVDMARSLYGDDTWIVDGDKFQRVVRKWSRWLLQDWGPRSRFAGKHPRTLSVLNLPLDILTKKEVRQIEDIWGRVVDELRARGELPETGGTEHREIGVGWLDEDRFGPGTRTLSIHVEGISGSRPRWRCQPISRSGVSP